MPSKKIIFSALTFLSGCLLLYFYIDYQTFLSQGDHGRDLYAFAATLRGEAPYRDYWWVYGPLMPYYYALFFKFLGIQVTSILVGKALLILISGVLFFLTLSTIIPFPFAYAGALWFWTFNPDFFFTYNHAGGITAILAIIYTLFLYLKDPRPNYLYGGLLAIVVLALIKLNFGITSLIVFLLSVFLIDGINQTPITTVKKQIYLFTVFILPPLILLTYFAFLYDLPLYVIRECFPYIKNDQQYFISLSAGIAKWFELVVVNMTKRPGWLFSGVVIGCFLQTLNNLFLDSKKPFRKDIVMAALILGMFYAANLHEFVRSGVSYRSFWAAPLSMLLIFVLIGYAGESANRIARGALLLLIFFFISQISFNQIKGTLTVRSSEQYLAHPRGKVFVSNPPPWVDTVQGTAQYLEDHLQKGETFLAFPYDPIFYYLTDRKSPTRQLIFFEHIHVPTEQEQTVIAELEQKKVDYIVLSNRISASESGLGTFGKDYCPLLKRYMDERYAPVQTFGDWQNEPGWAWNYGTMILKRK